MIVTGGRRILIRSVIFAEFNKLGDLCKDEDDTKNKEQIKYVLVV